METNHTITKLEGFPIEAEGTVGSSEFLFNVDKHRWRFGVGNLVPSGEGYIIKHWVYGDFENAGCMTFTEAKRIIAKQCTEFLKKHGDKE